MTDIEVLVLCCVALAVMGSLGKRWYCRGPPRSAPRRLRRGPTRRHLMFLYVRYLLVRIVAACTGLGWTITPWEVVGAVKVGDKIMIRYEVLHNRSDPSQNGKASKPCQCPACALGAKINGTSAHAEATE